MSCCNIDPFCRDCAEVFCCKVQRVVFTSRHYHHWKTTMPGASSSSCQSSAPMSPSVERGNGQAFVSTRVLAYAATSCTPGDVRYPQLAVVKYVLWHNALSSSETMRGGTRVRTRTASHWAGRWIIQLDTSYPCVAWK